MNLTTPSTNETNIIITIKYSACGAGRIFSPPKTSLFLYNIQTRAQFSHTSHPYIDVIYSSSVPPLHYDHHGSTWIHSFQIYTCVLLVGFWNISTCTNIRVYIHTLCITVMMRAYLGKSAYVTSTVTASHIYCTLIHNTVYIVYIIHLKSTRWRAHINSATQAIMSRGSWSRFECEAVLLCYLWCLLYYTRIFMYM